MGNPILHTLQRYDSAQDVALHSTLETAQISGTVVRTGLELFHGAASPALIEAAEEAPDRYELGLIEGERRAAERQDAAISAMEKSLAVLQTHFSQSLEVIRQEQTSSFIAVLETALPALVKQSYFQDARNMIKMLQSAKLDGKIIVRCAAQEEDSLSQLFKNSSDPERFKILPDNDTALQMTFEWENGGADIDYRQSAASAMQQLLNDHQTPITSAETSAEPITAPTPPLDIATS